MSKAKRKSVLRLAKRRCAYVRCKKSFKPDFAFQKYHSNKCRYDDHNLKRAEFNQWAKQFKKKEAANA